MNKINRKSITERENNLLPFLKLHTKDEPPIFLDLSIRKSKNIINNETFKLVDEFKILKFKKSFRNSLLQPNKIFKTNVENKNIQKLISNNKIETSEDNLYLKEKLKNVNTSENKNTKYKKIKNFNLSSGRDRYLSLIKKYQFSQIKRKDNLLDDSKTSNNNTSVLTKQNKSSSNALTYETHINKTKSISKILTTKRKITKKDLNKSFSKLFALEKELCDTRKNSINIIKRIKKYKSILNKENKIMSNKLNKNEESMKKIDDLIEEENTKNNKITSINYNKILGPLNKVDEAINLKKINLNKSINGQIWLKQSTANMIRFGQYFNRLDDEQFFKQRKKIINKFAAIEKDSDIIDGIRTERNSFNNFGKGIKKNNKIITKLAEKNFDFFKNVSKKFDNF